MNLLALENLSHATILTGNRQANLNFVKHSLSEQGFLVEGNPDFLVYTHESLGVDDARAIATAATLKKLGDRRIMVISFDRMTHEAQNALLKSIEEPQADTHFIILVPDTDRVLPTILSRCQVITGEHSAGETRMDVVEFLRTNLAGRFVMIEEWTKNKKDEDNLSKSEVIHFLDQLEKKLWEKGNHDEQLFTDIRQMRQYAQIRGASHRIILDFMALSVPVVK